MITGLLKLRMEDHIFKTNMVVFQTRILITKLMLVQPIDVMKMQLIKNTRRRTQTVNTSVSAKQERKNDKRL